MIPTNFDQGASHEDHRCEAGACMPVTAVLCCGKATCINALQLCTSVRTARTMSMYQYVVGVAQAITQSGKVVTC